jgi:Domain of unknown function (DUF5667)
MGRISIEEALDDCLQRLTSEGLDACLRRYPQYADELRGLLQLSMRVSRTGAATVLSNEVRARMRAQLFKPAQATIANPVVPAAGAQPIRTIPTLPLLPAARGSLFSRPLARAALVLLVLAALFIGGEVASARARSGQVLYPVKRFYEGVRTTFSFNPNDQANARLDFANTRLDEIEDIFAQKGTIDASTLTDLASNISYCTDQLKSSSFSDKQRLASAFGAALQREQQVLRSVSSAVATDARPLYKTAQDSITNDYQVATQYAPSLPPLTAPIGTPTASPAATPSPPATTASPTALSSSPTPTGAATATATPAITNTPAAQPSATSKAQPSATSTGQPKPSATPTRVKPQAQPSDTPLPLQPNPTSTHPPRSPMTPTPRLLKLTATPPPPRATFSPPPPSGAPSPSLTLRSP